jgi:hypothetical protein
MLKKALSVLTVMTVGAGLALGQDAITAGSSSWRPLPQSYAGASGYEQPVTPPGRPSPYGNYQSTSASFDGTAAIGNTPNAGCAACGQSAAQCALHGWFDVDYLLMFPSRMNVPVLLNTAAGAPLVGPSPGLGVSNGIRVNTGIWLCDGQIGVQGIAFGNFRSNVTINQATGVIPTTPLGPIAVTNFAYNSWHQLAGGEGNSLYRLIDNGETKVYVLGGTKYLTLEEDITTTYTAGGGNFLDEFHTRNQFIGGQVGATVMHRMGRLDLDATAKVALGVNYTQLFVIGSNSGAVQAQAFTGRSNIGFTESDYFGLIPEVNANLHYRLTERLSANLGYTFMMSINNWRPGDQITLTNNGGVTQPSVAPAVRSTYFIHGLTAGLTFNY